MKDSNNIIVGLGSVAIDIIGKVDQLPQEDGLCMVEDQQSLDGGSCANVMTQVAHLGAPSALCARVGDDDLGKRIVQGLNNEGIDTTWMMEKHGGTSLTTHIYVDPDGAKTIVMYMGDSLMTIDVDDVDFSFLDKCKVFYTDAFPPRTIIKIARLTKSKGIPVVFNMQTSWSLMKRVGMNTSLLKEMLQYTVLFAPCQAAVYELTGESEPKACIDSLRTKFNFNGVIILTLGERGSVISYDQQYIKVPAYKVNTVDTTGAGDSYIGAFMYAYYYENYDLEKSGRFASAAAALTCTQIGARANPTLEEVYQFDKWR